MASKKRSKKLVESAKAVAEQASAGLHAAVERLSEENDGLNAAKDLLQAANGLLAQRFSFKFLSAKDVAAAYIATLFTGAALARMMGKTLEEAAVDFHSFMETLPEDESCSPETH